KYYKEVCLVEQPFVKDGDKTIKALLKESGADVVRFTRFVMGEGLEKKEENLADEVQAQINSAKKN
ncbi:MAG: elongation factor Ts, partial [Clostridia bacterium]|nr:elongation factor Ts [Clostridia bacterium]